MKPGYKTTEFWFKSVIAIAGIILASGALVEGSELFRIISLVVSLGAGLGYTASRTAAKKEEARAADPRRP